ncbi:MAG: hypothetical protein WC867_00495 [Candidatus Pacearchaeota archaeon]|jgi:hypothetical protein
MFDSYIVYRDLTGEFGYSPEYLYDSKPELLEDVLVLYDDLTENIARKLTNKLNKKFR